MKTPREIALGHGYQETYADGRRRPDFDQAVDAIEAAQLDALIWARGVIYAQTSRATAAWYLSLEITKLDSRESGPAENTEEARIYPCADCGVIRNKVEGGAIFAVCDDCWDRKRLVTK